MSMPRGVIEIRRDLCIECAALAHDPCAACTHGHWGTYMECTADTPPAGPAPTFASPMPKCGVGTHLKAMLAKIGIHPVGVCQCNARATEMDMRGPAWCEQNIETIVGWLREEAERRRLPFFSPAARILIRRAIRKAEGRSMKANG